MNIYSPSGDDEIIGNNSPIGMFAAGEFDHYHNGIVVNGQYIATHVVLVLTGIGWVLPSPPLSQCIEQFIQKSFKSRMVAKNVVPPLLSEVNAVTVAVVYRPLLSCDTSSPGKQSLDTQKL